MSMVTTIEQAIRPLSLTAHILGLGVHTPGKLYLSILYNVTLWSTYSYLFCYVVIVFEVEKWFLIISSIIVNGSDFLVSIVSMITSLYQHKRLQMFIKRLAAVDDTLEELGIPKIYQKLHVCIKRTLIGWLICTQLANVNDMIWWFRITKNYQYMIIPYITNYYHHVNIFMDLVFTIHMWYIGKRFDKLNEHMRYLLLRDKRGVSYTCWRKAVQATRRDITCINYYKRVLWTAMHLHLELCQIAQELNAMFQTQLTMEMAVHLIYVTRLFHYTYINIIKNTSSYVDWIDISFVVSLHVARLFCLNYVCEDVSAKSNEMKTIINQLTDPLQYANIYDEIYQFTLQMIHRPLKFSGLGLFHFGNGFLRKFVMTILMFMVIVIQTPSASKAFMGS
ncbi:PREDICTED: uncharacterized protein LOC105569297 [Vollenhovia emeryi]|uniref:uncharacterized protein LOC105569297 n=1 Tax=Vollenhovia emeryi TaxID=411798 RepID=UPI0005F39B9B|nr:PREDICTED: uncharacterized protein LOC105569297 [Vollenhovia emeryi]